MNDDTRIVHDITCPRCPDYQAIGVWPRQLADLEVELHNRGHADLDAEHGLTVDPPAIPAPRVRDLTVVGLTRSVLRVLWGWAR